SKFAALVVDLLGNSVVRTLTALVVVVEGTLSNIGSMFSILGDLLTGDFAGAWATLGGAVKNTLKMLSGVIEAFWPGAIDAMRKLYDGVRDQLLNKLGGVFNAVGEKVRWVGEQFFKLYDAVVGHSYVPDLVTETGQWFAKLQELMVDPATRATEATADRFRRMRDELRGVLQGLMTDTERAGLELENRLAVLAQNRGALTPSQYEEQVRRARARYATATTETLSSDRLGPLGPMADGRDITRQAREAADLIKEQMNAIDAKMVAAADAFSDRFGRGLESALNGDLRGVLEAIFGDMRSQFRDLGRILFGMMQGGGGAGGKGGGGFSSFVASMFGKLPKFATGGSILPGGSGGTDSQLVAFWKSPHERVDIGAAGFDQSGGGGVTRVVVDVNDERFNAYVDGRAGPAAAKMGRSVLEISRRSAPSAQQSFRRLGTP
ncbi:MAG TPA: hypothetical protein VN018_02580, partial [Brevundimonas sp.]|nr:hypothetical protein [Brevundimonas sp.]